MSEAPAPNWDTVTGLSKTLVFVASCMSVSSRENKTVLDIV